MVVYYQVHPVEYVLNRNICQRLYHGGTEIKDNTEVHVTYIQGG